MPRRSDARKCVLQMLYLVDQNAEADVHWIRNTIEEELSDDEVLIDFAWTLFTGVRQQLEQLDSRITGVAENWRIDRMAPTDRNVLRMGLFELTDIGTPAAVVLNECVELAKAFGTGNSQSFVNGVLDRLNKQNPPATGND
jgi:N utilization substance protein B